MSYAGPIGAVSLSYTSPPPPLPLPMSLMRGSTTTSMRSETRVPTTARAENSNTKTATSSASCFLMPSSIVGTRVGRLNTMDTITLQSARERNRNNPAKTTRADASPSSLSGVAKCVECGATLRTMRNRGVARMVCNTRIKRAACSQKSARLNIYETQLQDYLDAFHIPQDYQEKLLAAQRQMDLAYDDTDARRKRLSQAVERLKELYKWGDIDRAQYQAESGGIREQLDALEPAADVDGRMERLAGFLKDVASAWRAADQERRNKLARAVFSAVWVENQQVLGVTPRHELKPFFDLQYSELSNDVLQWRPRPDSNRRSLA